MIHSRDPRKNPGIKRSYLPVPASVEGTACYCVTIPAGLDNKQALISLLSIATYWFYWDRTPDNWGSQVAYRWKELLNLPEGIEMCCCPQPTNRRYDAEGNLEVSYDNGVTWTPAPEQDDRFSGIVFPPITGADGNDKKCAAAASAQEYVKSNLIDELTIGQGYASIFDTIIAILAILGMTGIGALAAAVTAAIFTAGIAAVQAAFTTEVWTDFRCILYCRIRSDGSFSVSGWQGVKADILAQFTGVVSAVLYNWVNTVGPVGLTNSARSGFVAAADCSSCDCPAGCVDQTWIIDGTFVTSDDDSITIASILDPLGSGQQIVRYGTIDSAPILYCCHGCNFEIIAGAFSASAFVHCNGVYDPISAFSDVDFRRLDVASNISTFTVKINFNPDGCP